MPKSNPPSAQRSKVRIFFVDADLAPGDLQELTTALTSAIRPTHVISRNGTVPRLSSSTVADGAVSLADVEELESDFVDDTPVVEEITERAPAKKRNYRKPVPVAIDMKAGGKPFPDFAVEKGPSDYRSRYLVAASWLHDYPKITAITADHVFTCYKSAGWTFDIKDPALPLRKLKSEGLGTTKDGNFSINHLGLAQVETMKAAS